MMPSPKIILLVFIPVVLCLASCVNAQAQKSKFFTGSSPTDRVGVIWLEFDVENVGGFAAQNYGGALDTLSQGLENMVFAAADNNETNRKNLPVVKHKVSEAIEQELARARAFKYLRTNSLQGVLRDKKTKFMPSTDQMKAFAAQNALQQVIAIRADRRVPRNSGRWTAQLIIQPVIDMQIRIVKPDGRTLNYTNWGTLPDGIRFVPATDVRDPSLNDFWETSAREATRKIITAYGQDLARLAKSSSRS